MLSFSFKPLQGSLLLFNGLRLAKTSGSSMEELLALLLKSIATNLSFNSAAGSKCSAKSTPTSIY